MERSDDTAFGKGVYVAPKLSKLGSLERLTQSHGTGAALDASFSTSTPAGELTFS